MTSDQSTAETVWPLRTWVLAALGGLFAFAMQRLTALPDHDWEWGRRLVSATIVFLAVSGLSFGLAWQRARLVPGIVIALLAGLISGGTLLWNGTPDGGFGGDGWRVFCGVLASVFLLTLFQAGQEGFAGWPTGRSRKAWQAWLRGAILYPEVHGHLWTNALLLGLSALFTLLVFGIAHLFAEMFWLVKLGFLREAMRADWFVALLLGTAYGGALGLLRDRKAIISALQRVAMLVLRVLAPVVALAILLFLAALPFTGLAPLWDTGGTTPIMLVSAALALFLANAVVGDVAADESRSIVLTAGAAALGLVLVPMVGIAAFSSGLRIQQYGLSPDRLWALTFIIVASIVAIAYAVAILRRRGWFIRLRATNLDLVYLLAAITLILSTPLLSFERIATAHQLYRLAHGQVSPEAFDYKGLWFDFGPPGRAAIERLAAGSSDATVRRYAAATKKLDGRWADAPNAGVVETGLPLEKRLTMLPRPFPLDAATRARLVRYDACNARASVSCIVHHVPGQDYMIVVAGKAAKCDSCDETITLIRRDGKGWTDEAQYLASQDIPVLVAAIRAGKVEMRPVRQRQIFIDGKPMGQPIPPEDASAP